MPSLKDFVEAMSTSWPVALAIFLGSSATLIGEAYGIEYLATLPNWLLGTAFLLAVFSGAVLAVSLLRSVLSQIARPFRIRRIRKWKAQHIEKLQRMPTQEIHVLAWVAAQNTQVFLAPLNDAALEPLIAKGYVEIVPGHHSVLDWPHRIPDHVWDFMINEVAGWPNKDQIVRPFRY
jgi:hypothetical protein